jgi:ribokinase/sulfofructose kinase
MGLDVVCVGGVAVDHIYRLSHLPQPGAGAHILAIDRVGGGVEANVAAALARLGVGVGLVARVGDDADGEWVRDELKTWEMDSSRVVAVPGGQTDFCQVWVAPDGERMLACDNPSLRGMRLDDADRAFIARAGVLFLSGFVPLALMRETLDVAEEAGLSVAFDLPDSFDDLMARGLSRDDFWRLVPKMDLLMTNYVGMTSLLELEGAEDAFAAFRRREPEVGAVMSMGAQGAWLGCGDEQVFVEAFKVEAVDTTGAGDAFHAGLIYGWCLEGWSLWRAGLFASGLAALNCTGVGARGGLVGRDEVVSFLSRRGFRVTDPEGA